MKRIGTAVLGALILGGGSLAWTAASRRPLEVQHEVIAVYIGSAGTDDSTGMASTIRSLNEQMTRDAAARGERYISRGVSIEPTVSRGLAHLSRLGRFDEISAGGNWTNLAVLRYMERNPDGTVKGVIPQLVILRRDVSLTGSVLDASPEREIERFVGVDKIQAWVRLGSRVAR